MTDNTSTSVTNNRLTKAALEAEVEELREQLSKLADDTQLNSAQLSSVKRPKVLNLDTTPAEKHPEVYAEWTGSLKRYLKRLQVKQPTLTEKEFLLEVPDLLEGRLGRVVAKMERAETFPPDDLETFFKLIVNTYRIKPQGEVATELFRSARQYSLISEVCAKIRETPNFTGTVVVPEWPSQDWFGFLHDTCTSFELFPAEDGLFLLHGVHSQPSPPWNVLAFHFVDFSWTHVQLQFASSTDLAHSQAASSFDYIHSSGRIDTSANGQVSFLTTQLFIRTAQIMVDDCS